MLISYRAYLWQSSSPSPPPWAPSGWPCSRRCWSAAQNKRRETPAATHRAVSAGTYQHVHHVVPREALRKLPHLPRAGHVHDVDVDVLGTEGTLLNVEFRISAFSYRIWPVGMFLISSLVIAHSAVRGEEFCLPHKQTSQSLSGSGRADNRSSAFSQREEKRPPLV